MGVFRKVLRAGEGKKVKQLQEIVPHINGLEHDMKLLSDNALANRTVKFREELDNGEDIYELLPEAFATVRETAFRVIGQRHYDVQMMGGMALFFGRIAEMKTGEGKTLVSTLPAYLEGLTGLGVHMVTVNDYLAARDAEWMGRIFKFLGLSVGLVIPNVSDPELRRAAYASDITYGTNTEFGFDYLRDNMAQSREAMVQRGHNYAVVDEVDSILIDEARTPLIISGPADESSKTYYRFSAIARTLKRDEDYEVDEEKRIVAVLEAGIEKVERELNIENMYDLSSVNNVHHLNKALQAKELYKRDKEYIVEHGEVKIVDEFTGRTLEGRRWSDGLHQAVEAKERVQIKDENHTWATVTLQNYFRMYEKLSGMTGTAETEASEFANTYEMDVVPIVPNRPMVRTDFPDLVFKSEKAKFDAVINDLEERYSTGQPVLVGTASVEKSEVLSRLLEKRGIPHNVLNAKQHTREAVVVAQAGRLHAITVATNMAGRGVDILLGGNPEGLATDTVHAEGLEDGSEEAQARYTDLVKKFSESCAAEGDQIRELGGLYVLGSERHESRRIDNQLRGRSGRQGDPGESRFFLSLEDDLMSRFATGAMSWVMERTLPEDVPIEAKMVTKAVERAQGTVEAVNSEMRKDVLKYDEVMDKHRKVIYERRINLIDGEDLRDHTVELLEKAISASVHIACPSEFSEEWNLTALVADVNQIFPTKFTAEDLESADTTEHIIDSVVAEAMEYYEQREATIFEEGVDRFRALEREVMIQVIDHRWREHLAEMDYLREGINLRAMGQQDPLVAWQREGFVMFEELIETIDSEYIRLIMHIEMMAGVETEPDFSRATFSAQTDPTGNLAAEAAVAAARFDPNAGMDSGGGMGAGLLGAGAGAGGGAGQVAGDPNDPNYTQAPIVKSANEKLGRNEPCHCGSGKKFKMCHGRS